MLALAASATLLLAADAPPPMVVTGDFILAATVQATPARLRVDPGAPSMPVFNPDFAERAAFKSGMFGTVAAIGPIHVRGHSAVIRFDLGGGAEFKRRVTWFEARHTDADGTIGPGGLPADVVRFDLRPPRPGEHAVTLALADYGWSGMGTLVTLGGETIKVRFSLDRDRSLATAGAGALLASEQDGGFDAAPERMVVNLGVERPVRHMHLARPLQIGAIALTGLLVRTGDFGSAAAIPDANAPPGDPDEIVVTGQKKQKARLSVEIGRDYLDLCSSILFDKPARKLTLSCL
jgi:hypothetical protein